MSDCRIVIKSKSDRSCYMEVDGDVDLHCSAQLDQVLGALIDEGVRDIIFDFTRLGFIDTSGTMVLVHALKRVRADHGRMFLVCKNPALCKFFSITRLDRVFQICKTQDEAQRALAAA